MCRCVFVPTWVCICREDEEEHVFAFSSILRKGKRTGCEKRHRIREEWGKERGRKRVGERVEMWKRSDVEKVPCAEVNELQWWVGVRGG